MLRGRQLARAGRSEVVVGLAGGIAVRIEGEEERLLPPGSASPLFVAEGPAQLHLRLVAGPPVVPDGAALLFDGAGAWQVFRAGAGYCFVVSGDPVRGCGPLATITLDLASGAGEVRTSGGYPALGYPLDEILFAWLLARHDGLVVHACGAVHAGQGSLLGGVSGAGKTTLAGLLDRAGASVLSDDRVAVRLGSSRPILGGTPWPGAGGYTRPEVHPLGRLCFLRHAPRTVARRLPATEAAARLLALSVLPYWDGPATEQATAAGVALAQGLPAYELAFSPDVTAVEAIGALDCA